MKERKYKESYRLGSKWNDKKGRVEQTVEYTGEYWSLPGGKEKARAYATRLSVCVGVYWVCAIVYLKTAVDTSRVLYALMPMLLSLFPGVYALMGLYTLWRAPERMTVVQREKGLGRLLRACAGGTAFCFVATVGCVIWYFTHGGIHGFTAAFEVLLPLLCAAAMLTGTRIAREANNALVKG